ncbi:MAG: hypothetical protein KIH63_005000 [Candidatus Saccharibacteria bacterium]|nr:hypothetical protein [Candidatus Saccharibacteria bacterium]
MNQPLSDSQKLIEFLEFAKKLALEAGKTMTSLEDLAGPLPNNHQYINEYVAEVIEKQLAGEIASKFPDHSLFTKDDTGSEYEWICDYIDGAYAYSKKHRISVTSVALVHKGVTIVAVVFDPWTDTLYSAIKGAGFRVNDQLCTSPELLSYRGSLVDVEWWRNAQYDVDSWLHTFSIENDVYVLHIGSIIHAACLVAKGTFSAAVLGKFMSGKNHEIAAIKLLVEEAGCKLSDLNGNEVNNVGDVEGLVFANPAIHADLIKSYAQFKS